MTPVALVVVPPAMLMLRKLVRRIREVARNQFVATRASWRPCRKPCRACASSRPSRLKRSPASRFRANVNDVEREANKMARVSSRSSPLMESLGGIAIALAIMYGGFRLVQTTATPGEFFSFLAAFMLAIEPAKRLARLNIELNSGLVGVRVLYEILDSPPTEPTDNDKPALKRIGRARRVHRCALRLSRRAKRCCVA